MKIRLVICVGLMLSQMNVWAQENPHEEIPVLSYELMQDGMSCLEKSVPLTFNERVFSFADYFIIRNREYTKGVVQKSTLYFPIFEEVLAKHGMPEELKYLSIIESGLNPHAMSRVGAGGLWQFMPATGKYFGLSQSFYIDERMDPWESTEAACKYLKSLYSMFGDWEMALAAYNTGPGNVRKAIRRSGYKKTFWGIFNYLPRETRSYVPQYAAMVYVINHAAEYNLLDINTELQYFPEFDTVHVSGYMNVETFTNQIGMCEDDLLVLNSQIIRGALPEGTKTYALKIPMQYVDSVRVNKVAWLDSASKVGKKELEYMARNNPGSIYGRERVIYKVRSGDVLGSIAERHHVRLSDLKKWNNLTSNMIRVGQRLNIWVLPRYSSKTKSLYAVKVPVSTTPAKPVKKPEPIIIDGGKYHLVRSGDSLWSIANLYDGISIDNIKNLNNLTSSRIDPGQKLLISM
ncbi:MAG: transglycosylase SLT domain-containing protein [Reichenbachiella sp.]